MQLELDAENTVVTHLAASQQQATIAAGCSNGCLQLFDLRAGRSPVSTFTPQPGPMVRCCSLIMQQRPDVGAQLSAAAVPEV